MKKLVCLALALAMMLSCAFTVLAEDTQSEAEIVDAAFALEIGSSLEGEKTLTGVVESIVTPYSTQYLNVTVNLTVKNTKGEDKIIQCFRMKGDDAETVGVGDTITVTGKIKNYKKSDTVNIVEFDAGCTFVTVKKGEQQKLPETEEEILEAVFALANDTALSGTYSLTGVVASIVTPYSAEFENVTLNITVADKTIQCYRLKGDDAETVGVGDTITVTGALKNYQGTVEYDVGCTFVTVKKGEQQKQPETEEEILEAAFALETDTALQGTYSLTGVVADIEKEYTEQNGFVTLNITVADKTVKCYHLKGDDVATVAVGDTITVTGAIKNYQGTVEFDLGCTFETVEKGESGGDTPGDEPEGVLGDFDGDETVTSDDAVFLLRHTLFPESYPVSGFADFDHDGIVSSDDAVFLLRHTLFAESYPLTAE